MSLAVARDELLTAANEAAALSDGRLVPD